MPIPSAPDSGLFYFFGASNLEMLIKVLNACGLNDRYWVFFAATTNGPRGGYAVRNYIQNGGGAPVTDAQMPLYQ